MKIDNSISSAYGLTSLLSQRNKQQSLSIETSVRQSGSALQPSTTPPSISSTMWALQSGGSATINASDDEAKARHDAVISEFTELANMTPAERIRQQMLERLGISEDELASMPPEERAAVEKQIAEEIKKQLTGVDDNKSDTQDTGVITA
ncbi:hypothetical protein A6U87_03775 [Rhizobium sp. AC44/96]|uniref:hypothetical protein n=1 Tax=Rhizobium sp. AC44/96 TaxID=1841654 RepID=UPI00080FC85C|nr:hypothetical protein [Rhizobium sp. AC44/96]OCJ18040.1 hypothetical protein A6U87_03775 [Rhizobium sp. AC44/96]